MRAQMMATIPDQAGNAVQGALVHVYEQGTTTPVLDMFAAASGGSPITTLTSDSRGLVTGWFTTARYVDLLVTDNGHTAFRPLSPAVPLTWIDYTLTVPAIADPSVGGGGGASGPAGGVLAGTYPNPSFAADMATQAELDTHKTDAATHANLPYAPVAEPLAVKLSMVTTKGDLYIATASGVVARHAVPATNGQTLIADSATSDGWIADYPLSRYEAFVRPTNAIAETFTRQVASTINAAAPSSGSLYLTAIVLAKNRTINTITFLSGTTALNTGSNQWFCLIANDLSVLAKTADDTNTAWGSNTFKTLTISGGFTTTYSGLYYVGIVVVASTAPSLIGTSDSAATITGLAPIMCGDSTASLTNPASLGGTAAAITASTRKRYAYVS